MPIEIKDLFVTANVYDVSKRAANAPGNNTSETPVASQQNTIADEEMKLHIIDQAVQQVLYILERQKDR
jgi:hypothetical protein